MLKTYESEVSLRNREFYMKYKLEQEKLKEKQNDKEYLEQKKIKCYLLRIKIMKMKKILIKI